MVGARLAGPADDAALAALVALAARLAASQRGGAVAADDPLLSVDADVTVVGTIGSAVVGYATVAIDEGRRVARCTQLFTHPEARGVGVGHAVLTVVAGEARHRGCTGLDAYALPGDRDTKNFFESHAMTSRLLVVHRSLDDLPGGPGADES